jgi:site-specific recombinase
MASYNKLMSHPDKEEIIRWLSTEGVSVREIEKRLKQRYPRKHQQHLRVAFSTIQAFKKDHLNIQGKILKDIKDTNRMARQWAKKKEVEKKLQNSSAYIQAIKNAAEKEVDTRTEILKVFTIIEQRIGRLFDQANEIDFIDKDIEKLLIEWLKQFQAVIDQHKKYEEGYREQVDVNVNVTVMNEQIDVLRSAMRETLSEVDPALTMTFMGKLNDKMKELTYAQQNNTTPNRHAMLLDTALGKKIKEAEFE